MTPSEIVKNFAKFLDENDFAKAGIFMAADCVYHYQNQIISGKKLILQSYEDNFKKASSELDEINFFSDVEETDQDGCFVIHYLDKIGKNGISHDHRCEQVVKIKNGLIVEIVHRDLPGEIEKLTAFRMRAGIIARSPS